MCMCALPPTPSPPGSSSPCPLVRTPLGSAEADLKKLCRYVIDILVEESNVHVVSTPVVICGGGPAAHRPPPHPEAPTGTPQLLREYFRLFLHTDPRPNPHNVSCVSTLATDSCNARNRHFPPRFSASSDSTQV